MPSKGKGKARRRRNYSSDEEDDPSSRDGEGSKGSVNNVDAASPTTSSSGAASAETGKAWPVLSMDGSGQRLDQWVAKQLDITRSRVGRAAKAGLLIVDGRPSKPSAKARYGAVVKFSEPARAPITVAPEDLSLEVLFEDEWLLVVNKPAGMAVHPAGGLVSGTLVNGLLHHFGHQAIELEVPNEDDEDGGGRQNAVRNTGHEVGTAERAAEEAALDSKQKSMPLSTRLEALCLAGDEDSDDEDGGDEHGTGADLGSNQSINIAARSSLPTPPPPLTVTPTSGLTTVKPVGSELRQGIVRPGIVHRLDRFTSGCMVVAKEPGAHAHLHGQFARKTTERCYEAIVCGVPSVQRGTILGRIGRDSRDRLRMAIVGKNDAAADAPGKNAITHYEVVESFPSRGNCSLLRLVLETGRTHQIRVHCSAPQGLNLPLLGDDVYGGADSGGTGNGTAAKLHPKARSVPTSVRGCLDRQALHAKTLGFTHPMTGARMQFESPMAHDMAAALSTLRQLESR